MRSRLCRTFAIFSFDLYFAYIFFYSASILFYFARCRLAHRERESERECIYVHCVCALCWFAHWLGVRNGVFDRNVIFTHTPQATSSAVFSVAHLFRTMAKECNTSRHTNTHNTHEYIHKCYRIGWDCICVPFTRHSRHLSAKNVPNQWASSISGHMNTDQPINTAKYTEKETEAII